MAILIWIKQNGKFQKLEWIEKKRLLERHPKTRYLMAQITPSNVGLWVTEFNGSYYEYHPTWIKAKTMKKLIAYAKKVYEKTGYADNNGWL